MCRDSLCLRFLYCQRDRDRDIEIKRRKGDDAIHPADFMGDGMILGFWNYGEKR